MFNLSGQKFGLSVDERRSLLRAVRALEIAGLRAFLVHAKDESAKAFYAKLGFQPSPHNEFHLFLKVSPTEARPVRVGSSDKSSN